MPTESPLTVQQQVMNTTTSTDGEERPLLKQVRFDHSYLVECVHLESVGKEDLNACKENLNE